MIEIKVHQLLNAGYDLSEVYNVDVPEYMDTEFAVLPDQKVQLEIHKIEGGLSLNMVSQEIKGRVTCSRTLEKLFDLTRLTYLNASLPSRSRGHRPTRRAPNQCQKSNTRYRSVYS